MFNDLTIMTLKPTGSKEPVPWILIWFWSDIRDRIITRDNYTCQECGANNKEYYQDFYFSNKSLSELVWINLQVHHIISRKMGGTDHPLNLITLCEECHYNTETYGTGIIKKEIKMKTLEDFGIS